MLHLYILHTLFGKLIYQCNYFEFVGWNSNFGCTIKYSKLIKWTFQSSKGVDQFDTLYFWSGASIMRWKLLEVMSCIFCALVLSKISPFKLRLILHIMQRFNSFSRYFVKQGKIRLLFLVLFDQECLDNSLCLNFVF